MKQRGSFTFPAALALTVLAALPASAQTPYAGHGAGSLPPDVVARYAPPPLDADVNARIQMMLDVRRASTGRLTPDGKRMVFGWAITGTPQIWRLDGPNSFPIQLTGGEDRTSVGDITPDGRLIVVSRDKGGQEDPGIYLQSIDGGPLTLVQHAPGTRAMPAFVTADSGWLYFTANDISPTSYAVYRYALPDGPRELLFDEPGLWSIADHFEHDGGVELLLAKATGSLTRELYRWGTAERVLHPLLGQGEKESYDASFAASPGELIVRTNALGEFHRLYRWRQGELEAITPEAAMDVVGFGLDEPRRRLYFVVNDGGFFRAEARDAATFQPLALPAFADADSVLPGASTPDGRFLTLAVSTAKALTTSYVYDWQTGALTQWMLPSAPEVDLDTFAIARLERYPARDGVQIPMIVRYPKHCEPSAPPHAEPCPVVIDFHGGPESQARPGFDTTAQLYVDAGFIYVEPNVRGSSGYGKSWIRADDGPARLDVITDIDDAGRYWRQRLTRDGKAPRIGITGGSYGGYSTLIGMTMFAGTFDAGVSIVGMSSLVTFLENTAPYRRMLRASEYGDLEADREALEKLSPVTYLDRVQGPLLLIQGVDDPRVPAGEAVQIQEALAARGLDSRLILLEGEGHGAARRGARALMIGHTLRFMEEHLADQKP